MRVVRQVEMLCNWLVYFQHIMLQYCHLGFLFIIQITITGTRCAELGVFIAPEIDHNGEVIDGTTTFCAVEQYALSYYRQQGFDQGMHGERSPFTTLYALFVWDEIFSSGIPDVFRSPFQVYCKMCFLAVKLVDKHTHTPITKKPI